MFDNERTPDAGYNSSAQKQVYDKLLVIHRHRWLFVIVLTATVVLAVFQTRASVPQYQARASLLIEDERQNFVGMMGRHPSFDYWRDPELYNETQYSLLNSVALGERVARRLDLSGPPPDYTNPLSASAVGDRAMAAVTAGGRHATAWLRGSRPSAPDTAVTRAHATDRTAAFEAWGAHIAASVLVSPELSTRLVHVTATGPGADLAGAITNALVDEYVNLSLELRRQNTTQTLGWVQDELAKQKELLARSDQALIEYRESENALSLDDGNDVVADRLAMVNQQVTVAERDRVEKESVYQQVRDLGLTGAELLEVPLVVQHEHIRELRAQLTTLEAERARTAQRYGPRHPEMQQFEVRIAGVEQQLLDEAPRVVASIEADYLTALHTEQELRGLLAAQQDRASELVRKSASYNVLEREAESNRLMYETLLQREKEFEIFAHSDANNIQVIRYADTGVALTPEIWFSTAIFGMFFSVGLAFTVTYFNDRVQTPEELTNLFDLPMLGLVPKVRSTGSVEPSVDDVALEQFADAYRRLRTTVMFAMDQNRSDTARSRVLVVTSTQPGEGKTVTSCNLAKMLARGGAKVLLVDADLHRTGVAHHLGLPDKKGLSELLQGRISPRNAVLRTDDPNLSLIVGGSPPENPSELISGARMQALLTHLHESSDFDWIIVDMPPVMAVGDAVTLAPLSTGVMLVVGGNMTPKSHIQRTLEQLNGVSCRVIGGVLNSFDTERNRYYYKRYYYGNYAKAYRKSA